MPDDTGEAIRRLCDENINNPNSIILCIQDGSKDAESSGVADVVRQADPQGLWCGEPGSLLMVARVWLHAPLTLHPLLSRILGPMSTFCGVE